MSADRALEIYRGLSASQKAIWVRIMSDRNLVGSMLNAYEYMEYEVKNHPDDSASDIIWNNASMRSPEDSWATFSVDLFTAVCADRDQQ